MRRLAAPMRLLCVLAFAFAVIGAFVMGGSASLHEPFAQHRGSDHAAPQSSAPTAEQTVTRASALPATAATMPAGGAPLTMSRACRGVSPTSEQTADVIAGQLQRGILGLSAPVWQAADGGVSAPLADGRVVWLFGDTWQRSGQGSRMVSNSMLIGSRGCFTPVTGPAGAAIIPDSGGAGERLGHWPTAVLSIDRGTWSELVVFTNTVRRGGGFWGFTLLGASVTRFAVPTGGAPQRLDTVALTADDDTPHHVTWGTASATDDGWVYVYGTRIPDQGFGREVFVARCRPEDVANMGRWQFRGAGGWGSRGSITPVVSADPGTSHIISVFRRGREWFVVSKAGGDLGDDIGLWRSTSASGPFRLLSRTPRPHHLSGVRVRYMPLAHPEYGASDAVVVSMSRNVTRGPSAVQDVTAGRPEIFALPLP